MKLKQHTIKRLKGNYGSWSLITGATSGIGRELALKLGESGFNLVITGRRKNLLDALKQQLVEAYKVDVVAIAGDLSAEIDVIHLIEETEHLNLGIVILNAGFGTSGKFINSNLDDELNMLNLNCKAVLILTHHYANKMKSLSNKGAIVLLSSMVAFQGVPNATNYAATKAYVQSLGEALHLEFKSEDIDVLCAAPGPVETGFSARADMKMNSASNPKDIATSIIKAIGKKSTVFPGLLTKFLVYNLRMTPRWGKIRIMGKVMQGFTKHQIK
ncbi:SDR family oxidoreductase [Winogradskyella sp.]|uniref:SDR family NAD(P)-dependent oxidoreductase n=1 Tax=Winogradskyella sp. TaxID=1883156 RepID=UPI00261413EF|nr:SDR family NAD(P)-dependent oxidoreductase [Winogradskyella sp.]